MAASVLSRSADIKGKERKEQSSKDIEVTKLIGYFHSAQPTMKTV